MIFTNPSWNPQSNPDNRLHNVLLWDDETQSLILGFEDILRPYGDEDFNDVLFQVKAVPPSSDEYAEFNPEDENDDSDGDNVPDILDDFPDDGTRAYITSYFGTHVFEDLWPSKGDYDFNDVVIYYDIKQISNASSQLMAIIPEYHLQASGASYKDGFAVQFPFDGSGLTFTSMKGNPSPIVGLQKYVVKVFDSTHEVFGTNGMFNTENDKPYISPDNKEIQFKIVFDSPVESSNFEFGVPYNPFIFVESLNYPDLEQEEIEVHFADMAPTEMVADSLFRTKHDDSDATQEDITKQLLIFHGLLTLLESGGTILKKELLLPEHIYTSKTGLKVTELIIRTGTSHMKEMLIQLSFILRIFTNKQ